MKVATTSINYHLYLTSANEVPMPARTPKEMGDFYLPRTGRKVVVFGVSYCMCDLI